jgi:predicted transcriptional regulator
MQAYGDAMTAKARIIELDDETADRLEALAKERGLTVADLLAELAMGAESPPRDWEQMRQEGRGPWAPEVLAEDARRLSAYERAGEGVPWDEVKAWIHSWGTPGELPLPKPRKL